MIPKIPKMCPTFSISLRNSKFLAFVLLIAPKIPKMNPVPYIIANIINVNPISMINPICKSKKKLRRNKLPKIILPPIIPIEIIEYANDFLE